MSSIVRALSISQIVEPKLIFLLRNIYESSSSGKKLFILEYSKDFCGGILDSLICSLITKAHKQWERMMCSLYSILICKTFLLVNLKLIRF